MQEMQNKLMGALIGLARATDGNEHLISASSTAVVIESLTASEPRHMESLLEKVEEEKRKMVPDCFLCASPCGRTSAYDLSSLRQASPKVRELKYQILANIRRLAASSSVREAESLLYRALVAVGMDDYKADDLNKILEEIHSYEAAG